MNYSVSWKLETNARVSFACNLHIYMYACCPALLMDAKAIARGAINIPMSYAYSWNLGHSPTSPYSLQCTAPSTSSTYVVYSSPARDKKTTMVPSGSGHAAGQGPVLIAVFARAATHTYTDTSSRSGAISGSPLRQTHPPMPWPCRLPPAASARDARSRTYVTWCMAARCASDMSRT